MNEQLKNLIEDYKKTNWGLLLRKDMGDYHLKEIKPYLDFIKNCIDSIVNSSHLGVLLQSQNYQNLLQNMLQQFQNIREQIIQYKNANQNQQIITAVILFKTYIVETCQSLLIALRLQEEYKPDKSSDKPMEKKYLPSHIKLDTELKKYMSTAKEEMDQELKKIRQLQSQLSEQTVRAEASRYGDFFKDEAKENKKLSWWYGGGLLFFSLLTCGFAYFFLTFDQNTMVNSFPEFLIKGNVINRIFIFSILILIMSVIRREYLALRHQFTLNTHRHNALSSHKEILQSILKTASESDKELSNAILLELTRAMFSPQDSGFVKNQTTSSFGNRIVEIPKSLFNNSKS